MTSNTPSASNPEDSIRQTDFNMLPVSISFLRVLRLARCCCVIAFLAVVAFAHDIPNDVTVQAFVKPAGQRLQLLVRVPMSAMRDVVFPTTGPGYLDLERAS